MNFVPIIERLRRCAENGETYHMDATDCRAAISILERSTEMDRASFERVRTAKRAWAGWCILGLCAGLALPRILLLLRSLAAI